MAKAIFEIYPMKQSPDRWAWRLKVRGRVLCKSNPYSSKALAEKAIQRVQEIIPNIRRAA